MENKKLQAIVQALNNISIMLSNEITSEKPSAKPTVSNTKSSKAVAKAVKPVAKAKAKQPAKPKAETPYKVSYTMGKKAGKEQSISLETLTQKLETYKASKGLTTFLVSDAIASINKGKAFDVAYAVTSFQITKTNQKKGATK
jgi:hypothetical protein